MHMSQFGMSASRFITLGQSDRVSRRAILTNLGAAGLGLTILSACGRSSSNSAATTAAPADNAPTTGAAAASLQLPHVPLGNVSADVLLRGGEVAIVDTGLGGGAEAILAGLGAVGASWANVQHIVLTHNHSDRAGGLADVLEATPGAMVYAGDADLGSIESSAPLQAIGDGDEVLGLGVLNTPGHTAGSISLFDTATGILVAGDAINGDDGALTGANPQYSSDLDAAHQSIAKLAALDPRIAAFGHGGAPITSDVAAQLAALAEA
jgi:glyoxylase-like metal-dependent hydrolase (beta-lactamase superfamily II)